MKIGTIHAIFRFPVKSMAGESISSARLGWHGIEGDRRFAFRRLTDKGAFPWLTASKLPQLLLYKPIGIGRDALDRPAVRVVTPRGNKYELRSDELRNEISTLCGTDVELMNLKHGIFDDGSISLITMATVQGIARESARDADLRRFRPNIVIETDDDQTFTEDNWLGQTLRFGEDPSAPSLTVTTKDERCVMINLDPDTVESNSEFMKTVVRMNGNYAGVYGVVVATGEIRVGQTVILQA